MPQKGEGNKSDTGILEEMFAELGNNPGEDEAKTWLQNEYQQAKASQDNERALKIKRTQKALMLRKSRIKRR